MSKPKAKTPQASGDLAAVLNWLETHGTAKQIAEHARYGIVANNAYGLGFGQLKAKAKALGRDHKLALALWDVERYEARLLACLVDEPDQVTVTQMNAWARDFDNWGLVDTVCFHLFDKSAHAWGRLKPWARARAEFQKRAAFALLWSLGAHDKTAPDQAFIDSLALIEAAATDERLYVKKAVDMALRSVGRRNPKVHKAACATCKRLAASTNKTARWIGTHALKELTSTKVTSRL